jgi:hypothetical protein
MSAFDLGCGKTAFGASILLHQNTGVSQAKIATISGVIPTMFITPVRL